MVRLYTNTQLLFFRDFTFFCVVVVCFFARIAGNGASEKNLKEGVCAQFEKNFAKAKWRVRGIYYHTQQSCTSCQVIVLINLLENSTVNNRIMDKDINCKDGNAK